MAETFKVLGQREDVEFLGGSQTLAVVSVSYRTVEHQTYFEVRIPRTQYNVDVANAYGIAYSGDIEGFWDITGVVGMEYAQVPTPSGELQDTFTVTVASTSGNSTATLSVPFNKLQPANYTGQVSALRKQLDQVEAL